MPAFVQTEIEADAVTAAMNEDGGFLYEMWLEIADALHKGLLLDNTVDMLRGIDINEARQIYNQLSGLLEVAKSVVLDNHPEEGAN